MIVSHQFFVTTAPNDLRDDSYQHPGDGTGDAPLGGVVAENAIEKRGRSGIGHGQNLLEVEVLHGSCSARPPRIAGSGRHVRDTLLWGQFHHGVAIRPVQAGGIHGYGGWGLSRNEGGGRAATDGDFENAVRAKPVHARAVNGHG
jgi:hypothetical protein